MYRISKETLSETKSLDELISKMGLVSSEQFKSQLKSYREHLKTELPEFTEEEILKFDMYFNKFREVVYGYVNHENLLTAIEYIKNKTI